MSHLKTCGQLIRQINTALERDINHVLRGDDLTVAQVSLLLELYQIQDRTLSLKKLEQVLDLAQSTVAGIAARLEQKGFLEYREIPGDRRVKQVHMTAAGEICVLRARSHMADAEQRMFSGLTEEDRERFADLLEQVCCHIQ